MKCCGTRPFSERGVQRNRRGTHGEPDPAGRRKRHGLDVFRIAPPRPSGARWIGKPKFKAAVLPVFKDLYKRVATGKECTRVLFGLRRPELPGSAWARNYTPSAIRKCGWPARLPARSAEAGHEGNSRHHQRRQRPRGKLRFAPFFRLFRRSLLAGYPGLRAGSLLRFFPFRPSSTVGRRLSAPNAIYDHAQRHHQERL